MGEPVRPDPPPRSAEPAAPSPTSPTGPDPGTPPAPERGPAQPRAVPAQSGPPRRLAPPPPRVALVLAGALVLAWILYLARSALAPFVVGVVLAYLIDFPVERLSRLGLPRWTSVLVVYVGVAVVVVQALRITLRPLGEELATFIREFPTFTAQVADLYAHLDLPPAIREAIDRALEDLGHGVGTFEPAALLPVVTGLAGVVGAIVGWIIIPVWMFYLIKDRPALVVAAERAIPDAWFADLRAIGRLVGQVFGQWLRGQLFLGLTVGVATFAGLLVLSGTVDPVFGRFAILLSVIAGVLELLPIIGPIIAAVPAVLLALTAGLEPAIAAVVLYTVIQQVENNVLVPKIQGDAVELHPSAVMLALVVGGAIAGLLGAILALPIAAAGRDVFRYLFHRVDDPPASPDEAVAIIRARPMLVVPAADPGRPGDAAPAGA